MEASVRLAVLREACHQRQMPFMRNAPIVGTKPIDSLTRLAPGQYRSAQSANGGDG